MRDGSEAGRKRPVGPILRAKSRKLELLAGSSRPIITRENPRMGNYFVSVLMQKMFPCESFLERDNLCLYETDGSVLAYGVQPEPISYFYKGKERRYTPDAIVRMEDGTQRFVEVKRQQDLANEENHKFLEAVPSWFWQQGKKFELVTEIQIREEPRLSNAKLMLRSRHLVPTEYEIMKVTEAFSVARARRVGDLWEVLRLPPERQGVIYAMAIHRHIRIDRDTAQLSADSAVALLSHP